jgi:ribosomal protein S18 acetylase RimI-like enzyme
MIRPATEQDIPALIDLLGQILWVHHQARPDLFKPSGSKFSPDQLKDLLADASKPIFVYENPDGQVVGHLFLQIQEPADTAVLEPVKTVFIDDLCVDQEVRGQKIGEQLYQFALDYAKSIGAHRLTLDAWADNQGAHRFYQRLGMHPMKTTFETRL